MKEHSIEGRREHAKSRFYFVERLLWSGHHVALPGLQISLFLYPLGFSTVVLFVIWYFTTYKVCLTTDPSPYRNTIFQSLPCDYAIVENRWTGRRRVFDLSEGQRPRSASRYVEKILYVNWLKDRLHLYIQKTNTAFVVDISTDLNPYQFMTERRKDGSALVGGGCSPTLTSQQSMPPGTKVTATTASPPTFGHRILVEAVARMRDGRNRLQHGRLLELHRITEACVRRKVNDRYYQYVLQQALARSTTKAVYAKMLIRNGVVTGEGVTLADIITDLKAFSDEVFAEVTRDMADDVILYSHSMQLLQGQSEPS